MKSRNPVIEFDYLKTYFGEPYVIDLESAAGKITVYQPTIGDIVTFGEPRFLSTLNIFTTNTTSYKLGLWESGMDWNEVSDFQLFTILYTAIDPDASKIIFRDIDFGKFKPLVKQVGENQEVVLYDEEDDIEINEEVYHHFCQNLRYIFNIHPEEIFTRDKHLKQWYITKEKRHEANKKKGKIKEEKFSLQPIISACVNHPGFKYKLKELKEVGVCEFYDSVQRLQIYESTTALMKGMYSGMIDSKNIKPDDYNFMKQFK